MLANTVDPDQMPHYVVSDLGPHCLLMTLVQVSRYERCCGQKVRAAGLWCIKLQKGGEFEAGLSHPVTRKLSLSTQQ